MFIPGIFYRDVLKELPPKGQLCLCECPNWCEIGYQVAKYDGKEFYYEDQPNDNFHKCVEGWIPLTEFGEPDTLFHLK